MVIPQGTIILVDFDPTLGHEQKGRRPALVISNETFLKVTKGLVLALPITSSIRDGYPLHLVLDERTKTQGAMMMEQAKTLDTKARNPIILEQLPEDLLKKVLKYFKLILE